MIRSMFKLPKHKKFEYQPRYYDPVKEEMEQRIAEVEGRGASVNRMRSFKRQLEFQDKFKEATSDRLFFARMQHQRNMSRLRFLLIVNILLIIVIFAIYKLL